MPLLLILLSGCNGLMLPWCAMAALYVPTLRTRKLAGDVEAAHGGRPTVRHVYGIGACIERQAVRHLQLALQHRHIPDCVQTYLSLSRLASFRHHACCDSYTMQFAIFNTWYTITVLKL